MTQTRKAQGRYDLVHLLRRVQRTEIRKVTEKVAMAEVLKSHQNSQVKVREEKRTDYFVQISRKEVANGKIHVIIGMFPECTEFKAP